MVLKHFSFEAGVCGLLLRLKAINGHNIIQNDIQNRVRTENGIATLGRIKWAW